MSQDNRDREPSRRRLLKGGLTLIPALSLLGTSDLLQAAANPAPPAGPADAPVYFNAEEWLFLLAACDRLIPSDALGPGAVAEGVPHFIDRQMDNHYGHGGLWYMRGPFLDGPPELGPQSPLTPRELYRVGIAAVNAHCRREFAGQRFDELDDARQEQVLEALEKDRLVLEGCPARLFFQQLLGNTREGWLSDPLHGGNRSMASWKLIGFPGARADYADWADRPGIAYPQGPVDIAGRRS
ncbi:gluconate 2-dehydrogenase gamma chain [Pseudomonas nitritireducens]|uniref:Gluconate 2-dehydrogenase gamma chain n=1 Tax=Pseudomonas nitroreducens TaxID=46680 RepID=A0A7W7KPF9_PSENT|nr:gluconate 2-dehydrogenase subunit 3 family protein [Pseudomonas nitritireducens]MBB4865863.1 gluconate 2-dehydrogenase gamma chain [Pseudomonas nitritireducens]